MLNAEEIRKDFPLLQRQVNRKPLIYFDNSATSQKPRQVIQAVADYYAHHNANIHRGVHTLSEEATLEYEKAHDKAADFVHAAGREEIIFTKNTTECINLLAYSLMRGIRKGEEIVLTQMEHHSNLVPWQQLARQAGAVVKFLEISREGTLRPGWEDMITKKTKIVSVTHMSNVLGAITPAEQLSKVAHENGALCIIDGAQSVPHMPVDVRKLGCDFLAWSGHKMLGPTGIGVLFGRQEILDELPPFLYGGDMIREVAFEHATWNSLPWKFEAGTPNVAAAAGLAAAIDYLKRIGMEAVIEHEKELTAYAFDRLSGIANLEIYGPPPEQRGGLISFNISGMHAHDLASLLDHDGIAIRGGHHCAMPLMGLLGIAGSARASFYVYNTKEEIDAFAESLKKAKQVFGIS
jgi:cysteine desulfurase/selenocysteine lyase